MLDALRSAGFADATRTLLSGGITQLLTGPGRAEERDSATEGNREPVVKAVTRRLERDVDLNGVARGDGYLFVREGVGLAGRGVATRGSVAEVLGVLAAIERDDAVGVPGTGPVAFGALPFLPGAPGELVIPSVVVGKAADGTRWVTSIDGAEAELPAGPGRPGPRRWPGHSLRASTPRTSGPPSSPGATRCAPVG